MPSKYSHREDHKIIREQVAYVTSDVEAPGPSRERTLRTVQCHNCKEFGHFRRDCPNTLKNRTNNRNRNKSDTGCDYCQYNNHVERDCHLKRKHNEERAARSAKKPRLSSSSDHLNSQRGRPGNAPTVQVFDLKPNNGASSTSETTIGPKTQ